MPFQVARFSKPVAGGIAFATLGLSSQRLGSRSSSRTFLQELLMLVPSELREGSVPALLQQVGTEMLTSGRGLLRGEVIGPRGKLFPGSEMEALYAAIPVYLPDEFATYRGKSGSIAIVWLLPISHAEAHFVFEQGWNRFEDKLADSDPDLVDIARRPVV